MPGNWGCSGAGRQQEQQAGRSSASLFPPGSEKVVRGFLDREFIDVVREEAIHSRRLEIITDDNMLTEYRFGRRF